MNKFLLMKLLPTDMSEARSAKNTFVFISFVAQNYFCQHKCVTKWVNFFISPRVCLSLNVKCVLDKAFGVGRKQQTESISLCVIMSCWWWQQDERQIKIANLQTVRTRVRSQFICFLMYLNQHHQSIHACVALYVYQLRYASCPCVWDS